MSTVKHCDGRWHRGAWLGVCPKRECVCRKARKTNNAFYLATKSAFLKSLRTPALHILHVSLLTHQLVRSEVRAWTVFGLTWTVVDKCNLELISCLLKLLHGPYTVSIDPYSPEQGKSVEVRLTSKHSSHRLNIVMTVSHRWWTMASYIGSTLALSNFGTTPPPHCSPLGLSNIRQIHFILFTFFRCASVAHKMLWWCNCRCIWMFFLSCPVEPARCIAATLFIQSI